MREENIKQRQVKAKEEHAKAVKQVEDCRNKLADVKQQVSLMLYRQNDYSFFYITHQSPVDGYM